MHIKKIVVIAALLLPLPVYAQTATINWTDVHQQIAGFGASDAQDGFTLSSSQQSFLFGTGSGQIGLSIMRAGVPENTTAFPGNCATVNIGCAGDAGVISDMQQMIAAGGIVYASPWSPPAIYTTNGSTICSGDSGLATAHYADYANWIANYVTSLKTYYGITLSAISVQNEPDICPSYDGGAVWTAAQIDTFVKSNLGPTFAADGITTPIFVPETSGYGGINGSNGGGTCATDSGCYPYLGGYNFHDYDASLSGYTWSAAPLPGGWASGKQYWETEVSCYTPESVGPNFCQPGWVTNITDGMNWAGLIDQRIAGDGANAWLYWQFYQPTSGDGLSLISDPSYGYPARLYTLGQYAKFVRPGYYRIDATHNPQTGVTVSAYQNTGSNTLVIIASNQTNTAVSQQFAVTNAPTFAVLTPTQTSSTNDLTPLSNVTLSGNTFIYLLPAQSVTTFVGTPSGGSGCPANAPSGLPTCYFVAANGSDSNAGTSESSPWLHAPGMPACSNNCAALSAGTGGIGIILRGGDTWHEGNASASPYTGGAWDIYNWFSYSYAGADPGCDYEGTQSGCIYVGVDPTWYTGATWERPIITGDNPAVASGYASSCPYQTAGSDFGTNNLTVQAGWSIFDSIELTGLCASASNTSIGNSYFAGFAAGGSYVPTAILENVYAHGWSATSSAGSGSASHPVTVLNGGAGVHQAFDHIVIDGSDSNPEVAAWGTFPEFYHMRDSIVRYTNQGVGQACHDIHDNIFEHFFYTVNDGHINAFECNADATTSTANVFYNNTFRDFDPSFGNGEIVWFCPNTTPEYWFNNLMYDTINGAGQSWNVAGTPTYAGCPNTGGQYMFNNTLVDQSSAPCYLGSFNNTYGQYITTYNNQLINTPWDGSGSQTGHCSGGPSSSTNVSMTDAAATSQGYTTGSSGTVSSNTCANGSTRPCQPTASSNSTVGAGTSVLTWCNQLATYSSEYAIGTEAANACRYSTTNGCAYNSTTHTMSCPAQTAVAR